MNENDGYKCVYPATPQAGKRPLGCVAFYYYQDGKDVIGLQLTIIRQDGYKRFDLTRLA